MRQFLNFLPHLIVSNLTATNFIVINPISTLVTSSFAATTNLNFALTGLCLRLSTS